MRIIVLLIIGTALAMVGGCQAPRPVSDPREASARAFLGSPEARSVPVFDGGDGRLIPWRELVAMAAAADVVLIGELHGHPLGSASAAALWEDLLATPGVAERAALSLEFFDRSEQHYLDDYLTGLIDEPAFLSVGNRTNYAVNPFGHRAMINTAKACGAPVIAANAPRVYVRAARRDGYDRLASLTPEQRRLFRIPDQLPPPESGYRARFEAFMSGESSPEEAKPASPTVREPAKQEQLDASFRSQSLWDWTMAESIVRAVESGRRPVVQVIGQFHTNLEGGTVLALRAMNPSLKVLNIAFMGHDARSLRDQDRGAADVVIYTGPISGSHTSR
ncbi:MAG: ChaN family lipoprotein [Phycisphaerales bacterium]